MSDYIKREDALNMVIVQGETNLPLTHLYDVIENLPSADVVKVKHGRWEIKEVPCI